MTATFTRGESPAARFVHDEIHRQNQRLHNSAALGMERVLLEELAEVWEECSQPDWDAYNALPVSRDSLAVARRLLLALPLGTKLPSIGATPSGHISLEWHHSRRRTLTVTVNEGGDLHYAALLGPGRTCGTDPFFDEVPQVILDLIARVCQC